MPKYHFLALQALHVLSAKWRDYLTSTDDILGELTPIEQLLINDTQAISSHITVQALQVIHPYLPTARAQRALDILVVKRILEPEDEGVYRYGERASKHVAAVETALHAYLKALQLLPPDKADHLAVLTTAVTDGISTGPNPVPTPIFNLVAHALTPADFALGQLQQRLVALLAYRDDVHIAAWTSEGYSPVAVRVATHLYNNIEMQPLARFLESPIYYDEAYVKSGLEELQNAGDIVEVAGNYQLSVKGATRRERVEHVTNENFDGAFQKYLSTEAQTMWSTLMGSLIEAGRAYLASYRSTGDGMNNNTLVVPRP